MEKLEIFIKENREKLDRHEPDLSVWENIAKRKVNKNRHLLKALSAAAIILLVVSSSLIIFLSPGSQPGNDNRPFNSKVVSATDLRETEHYYASMLNGLMKEAGPLLAANPRIEEELFADMTRLDSLYVEIRNDLRDNVSNQEVIEALIVNYRIKVQILEEMLTILEDNQNDSQEKNSDNEI